MAHQEPASPTDDFHSVSPTDVTAGSSGSLSRPYQHDLKYYLKDIVILVEGFLFKVPKDIFAQSEAFQDMFRVPLPEGVAADGSDDEHPLHLEGYLAEDFRQLMRIVLPIQHSDPVLTSDEWVSVLKLSTIWGFHSVRSTAVGKLAAFASNDPVLKVVVAKKYSVTDWFVSGLDALAQREEPLDFTDFERFKDIGNNDYVVDFLLRVARVRESFCPVLTARSSSCYHYHGINGCTQCHPGQSTSRSAHNFSTAIRQHFASHIASLEAYAIEAQMARDKTDAESVSSTSLSMNVSPSRKRKKNKKEGKV